MELASEGNGSHEKEIKEKVFLNSYVSIIEEIPDKRFEDVRTRPAMLLAYTGTGARKKILEGGTLWRKYENELNEIRKFALKFQGVGCLLRLPSGTAQLQQMKRPLIINGRRNILQRVVWTMTTTFICLGKHPRGMEVEP